MIIIQRYKCEKCLLVFNNARECVKHEAQCTEEITAKAIAAGVKRRIAEKAPVVIAESDETGEHLFTVEEASDREFWLDAFPTKQEAEEFCIKNNLPYTLQEWQMAKKKDCPYGGAPDDCMTFDDQNGSCRPCHLREAKRNRSDVENVCQNCKHWKVGELGKHGYCKLKGMPTMTSPTYRCKKFEGHSHPVHQSEN